MKRFTRKELDIIKKLSLEGKSINQICKKLDRGKSTIYYHTGKIVGAKYVKAIIPKNEKVLGEFLGAFAGDGSIFHDKVSGQHTVRFHLHAKDDYKYGIYLKKLVTKHFNKIPKTYIVQPNGLVLKFFSKEIHELIYEYLGVAGKKGVRMSIKKPLNSLSDSFVRYFIRGLIDTDGCSNRNGSIVLGLIAKKLILQVSKLLDKFDIKNTISVRKAKGTWKDLWIVRIPKSHSLRYVNIIGFSNKRKEKIICASRDSNTRS